MVPVWQKGVVPLKESALSQYDDGFIRDQRTKQARSSMVFIGQAGKNAHFFYHDAASAPTSEHHSVSHSNC